MKPLYTFQSSKMLENEANPARSFFFILLFLCLSSFLANATIRYVKPTATGTGDGSSWANASADLQAMIDASASNDEVWVAAGTYKPSKDPFGNSSPTDPRDKTFYLKNQVKLYGSFAGTETLFTERTPAIIAANPSILSGDINSTATNVDDIYHVVLTVSDDNTTIFDGFTVTKGYADLHNYFLVETLQVYRSFGGGLCNFNSSLSVSNCIFTVNIGGLGGGMANTSASPTISNCSFTANSAISFGGGDNGGGMYNNSASPIISNCSFSNNVASLGGGIYNYYSPDANITHCSFLNNGATHGGGIYNFNSSSTITDCSFSANNANGPGGGIHNNISSPIIANCIFANNSAYLGSGIYNNVSSPPITNCSFYANSSNTNGSGITNTGLSTNPLIKNSIFWNNINDLSVNADIANFDNANATVTYTSLQLAVANYSPALGFLGAGTGNIYATDPLFFNINDTNGADNIFGTADDGLALQNCSPAINAGTNTGITATTDITGATRIQNSTIDMGAYENGAVSVNIAVNPSGAFCFGTSRTFTATPVNGGSSPTYNFKVNTVSVQNSSVATYTTTTLANNDVVTVEMISNLCSFNIPATSNSITMEVYSLPIPTAGSNSPICAGNTLNLTSSGGSTYAWTGPNSYTSTDQNANFSNASISLSGTYIVTVTNANGCTVTTSIAVLIKSPVSRLYVNDDATGANNGSSWADAFTDLQSAFDYQCYDEVWVAAGTYKPSKDPFGNNSPTDARQKTFYLQNTKKYYGGFAGTETLLSQRTTSVIAANPSILSGDIGTPTDDSDNAYHVVLSVNDDNTTIFDGFTITKGNASGDSYEIVETFRVHRVFGGGIFNRTSSLTISNCIFNANSASSGGGLVNYDSNSQINNCNFTNNSTGNLGGGLYNYSSDAIIIGNCSFTSNSANQGGGMYNESTSLTMMNCSFSNNNAGNGGGLFYRASSISTISNCNFNNNNASYGGGAYFYVTENVTLNNCTFTSNTSNWGGGIYNWTATTKINNCAFSNNTANADGGGIYHRFIYDSEHSVLNNCVFIANSANNGGGMYINYRAEININNCTFSNNNATSNGGGLEIESDLFVPNSGGGFARAYIKNCIFWENKKGANSNVPGADIENLATTAAQSYVTYSILQLANNTTNYPVSVSIGFVGAGTGNKFATNPLFVNASDADGSDNIFGTSDDGLAIQNCSPAMNSGNNADNSTTTDITGAARIQNVTIDMGAYEITNAPATIARFYVKANATGASNGTNWADAYNNLQDALTNTCFNSEIWVASGTYKPTTYPISCTNCSSIRDYAFLLKNQTKIYGGFAGTETSFSQRTVATIATNPSILNGDIGTPNVTTDNVYHVVISLNDDNTTLLDGFTITQGNADGSGTTTIETSNVSRIQGGGLYNGYNSSSVFNNCNFIVNNASFEGGAMLIQNNLSTFTYCNFSGNTASKGGAIMATHASPTMKNCTISNNIATYAGGIYNYDGSSPNYQNCTFSNNIADNYAGAMFNQDFTVWGQSNPIIKNCIFWGNKNGVVVSSIEGNTATVSYSDVEGGYAGASNINQNPLFVNTNDPDGADNVFNTSDDGLALQSSSPAINQGDPITTSPIKDITDFVRTIPFDMGAYEYRTCSSNVTLSSTIYDYSAGTFLNTASSVNGKITATNKISGTAKVIYKAKTIELNAGFKAESGTIFLAEVGGCN